MANRFDISTTKTWKLDDNDNLVADITPTRAGIFIYHDGKGGTVRELRHPDDVFSKETLDSLNHVPYSVQKNHIRLFTPKDTTGKAYGVTLDGAIRNDNNETASKVKIWDESEIEAVFSGGSLELSCGYKCDYYKEPDGSVTSGIWEGQHYDARQRNIKYNHVCRVEKARGGETCRIHLDSDSAISGVDAERLGKTSQQEKAMAEKIKVFTLSEIESGDMHLDALDIEIDESKSPMIEKVIAREGSLLKHIQKLDSDMAEKEVAMAALKTENASLVKVSEGSISKEKLDQEVQKVVDLNTLCVKFGVEKFEDMTIAQKTDAAIEKSGLFGDMKFDSDDKKSFAIEHMSTEHAHKVFKSKENLDNSGKTKLDLMYEEDSVEKPSALEIATKKGA